MKNAPKLYLGDGVYAEHDGYHIILTTENGIEATNRIALEGQVYEALVRYAAMVKQHVKEQRDAAANRAP